MEMADLANAASVPTAKEGSIPQNHNLASSPLKSVSCLSESPNFTNEFYIEHAQRVKKVKRALQEVGEDRLEVMTMIDVIQRLGIDYHFHEEIGAVLQTQYMNKSSIFHGDCNDNLYEVVLTFRLLRQQGYHVHADFLNKEGKFEEKRGNDVRGLLGLYEASQVSIQGEDILDEAGRFSSELLGAWEKVNNHHCQARLVRNSLQQPFHKSLPKFTANDFLNNLQAGTNEWINAITELAKMDFKLLKSIHRKEIQEVSRWWTDLGLAKELKFARDQPIKWYMWPMAVLPDPSLSDQRVELTKPISLIYIIDDIFDVGGTLEELTLFTEAVNRWDCADVEQLPDYMKICFKALYGITNEISYKVYKEHGWNPIASLQKTWASLCNAFLVEANWFAAGDIPKAEEYLKNGVVSSGVHVVLVHLFFLLGQGITKDNVKLVDEVPGIISSTAKILRLWDDMGTAKDENQEGRDGSYLEYYMKEHQDTSVENAREHVMHMISEVWKSLNKECLSPNPFSPSFTKACLNAARMVPMMYSYDDNQCLPSLEEHIKSLVM